MQINRSEMTFNDNIHRISTKICPPSVVAGTVFGLTMASGGSMLFTYLGNGNLKQAAVISCGGYMLGRFFWMAGDMFFNCDSFPERTRIQHLLESMNRVLRFVLLGSFPVYGCSVGFGYPPLTLEKGALYVGGIVAPFAALSTLLGIIKNIRERRTVYPAAMQAAMQSEMILQEPAV